LPPAAQVAGAAHEPVPPPQSVSAVPAATAPHVPFPAAHDKQAPHEADAQQTPSMQLPVAHSVPALHSVPLADLEGMQLPPLLQL